MNAQKLESHQNESLPASSVLEIPLPEGLGFANLGELIERTLTEGRRFHSEPTDAPKYGAPGDSVYESIANRNPHDYYYYHLVHPEFDGMVFIVEEEQHESDSPGQPGDILRLEFRDPVGSVLILLPHPWNEDEPQHAKNPVNRLSVETVLDLEYIDTARDFRPGFEDKEFMEYAGQKIAELVHSATLPHLKEWMTSQGR